VTRPLRVGIVGANAARGWARDAHAPALAYLRQFTLAGVSARTQALADEAQAAFRAQRAYADSIALARAPDIDVVAVTVKVPEHRAVVLAALEAGKHVYCEWPLGRDLAEAQEMAAAVKPGQHAMIGLQALSAPAIRHAVMLARSGALGCLQVLRVLSPTAGWGAVALPHYAYLQDKRTGATFEAIAGGHTVAAIEAIVGAYVEVDARSSTLVDSVKIPGRGELVKRTCSDHMMVLGKHESGCVSNVEIVGGAGARPFQLELSGERGWLKIAGGLPGGFQVGNLQLETNISVEPAPELAVPELRTSAAAYVAEAYTRFGEQIRTGIITVPDFAAAARLTRLLETIEVAAQSGTRQRPSNPAHRPPNH
jgi:predicted dehydrogenase